MRSIAIVLLMSAAAHADINDMVNAALWRKQPDVARQLILPKTPQSGIEGMTSRAANRALATPAQPKSPSRAGNFFNRLRGR